MVGYKNPRLVWTYEIALGTKKSVCFTQNKGEVLNLDDILKHDAADFLIEFVAGDVAKDATEPLTWNLILEAEGCIGSLRCSSGNLEIRTGVTIARSESGPPKPAAGAFSLHYAGANGQTGMMSIGNRWIFPVATPLFKSTKDKVSISMNLRWGGAPDEARFELERGDGARTGLCVKLYSFVP